MMPLPSFLKRFQRQAREALANRLAKAEGKVKTEYL